MGGAEQVEERYLISLDLGTSGAKAGVFALNGHLLGLAQEEYTWQHPQPGYSEIDPQLIWQRAVSVVRQAVTRSGVPASRIAALGLSVIGETCLPVDEQGEPVYPVVESMDVRANAYARYVAWWHERFGAEAIFRRTSYPLSSLPPAVKILWWRDEAPEVFRRAARFVTLQDYAIWRLTGHQAIDYSMASRTMLFDVRQKRWIPEYLRAIGICEDRLSPPCEGSTPVGRVTADAARETGLAEGTVVVPGAHDQACAALGVGALHEGIAMDGSGSVEAIVSPTRTPIGSPSMLASGQGSQCSASADLYLALGFHLAAGSLVRWYRDQLSQHEWEVARRQGRDVYDLLTEAARQSPPGARGLMILPHLCGAGTGRVPALNPRSRAAILGLGITHTKADLSRAVFEGITYETRFLLSSLEETGIYTSQLIVTGGAAKSPFWLQLKADITQKRIAVPEVTEASLLGAALLAGVGAGIYASIEDAVARACRQVATYDPNPTVTPVYDRFFAIYQDVYPAVIGLSERLCQAAAVDEGA